MTRADHYQGSRRAIRAAVLATLALAVLVAPLAATVRAQTSAGSVRIGCGVVVDAAHPWYSFVPGGIEETGDHWIAARGGRFGNCQSTRQVLHRLLALGGRTFQGRDVAHLLGSLCDWQTDDGHERVVPFAWIICHLPAPGHPRTATTSYFSVDGDPNAGH